MESQEDTFGRGGYVDVMSCTVFLAGSATTCGRARRYLRDFPGGRAA